jgi:translation initiation factor 3 subunit F
MEDSSLYLATSSQVQVKVQPVVIFSILDHFIRRNDESQTRVIGTLLGTNIDGVIEVKSCFPVIHSETDSVWLDEDYHHNMLTLHQKASPKEMLVGWYATGVEIDEVSTILHEFYANETTTPILLTVDTTLTNNTMAIKAFTSTNITFGEKSVGYQFLPLPCEIRTLDTDKIGVDVLIKAKNNPKLVVSSLENIETSVEKLISLIDTIYEYVNKVLEGKVVPSNNIGRFLAGAVAALPKFDRDTMDKIFNANLQDLLMVVYLANLTRTQLSLAEKLQRVV